MTFADSRVHFIGIGGIGVSGLAKMYLNAGCRVTGSDIAASGAVKQLRQLGISISVGQAGSNIPPDTDLVVISAAIKEDNPELAEARRRGLKIWKYAKALGALLDQKRGIAVAGTHGKTTTSAMIAHILDRADLDPTFLIGARVRDLGGENSGIGDGEFFVAEACEYDRSFHELRPEVAVINNVEEDHLDYYKGLDAIIDSFRTFAGNVRPDGLIVRNAQDKNVAKVLAPVKTRQETFGVNSKADWTAEGLEAIHGRYHFGVRYRDDFVGAFQLRIPGVHNVMNALAATAVAWWVGVEKDTIRDALGTFSGADRRFEIVYDAKDFIIVDDYAHHPTEIQVTLKAARDFFGPKRLWVVFQPHQHSRTRFLLRDFAQSFALADRILVPDIYFVRDSDEEREAISSLDLVNGITNLGGDARYMAGFEEIVDYLDDNLMPGDALITLGAGNVNRIAYEVAAMIANGSFSMV